MADLKPGQNWANFEKVRQFSGNVILYTKYARKLNEKSDFFKLQSGLSFLISLLYAVGKLVEVIVTPNCHQHEMLT